MASWLTDWWVTTAVARNPASRFSASCAWVEKPPSPRSSIRTGALTKAIERPASPALVVSPPSACWNCMVVPVADAIDC